VYLRNYRHLSYTVLSCIVSCECEHYVRIFDQRCLMLATYRYWLSVGLICIKDRSDYGLWNCIYVFNVLLRFFQNPQNMTFYVFLSCCTRFLKQWLYTGWRPNLAERPHISACKETYRLTVKCVVRIQRFLGACKMHTGASTPYKRRSKCTMKKIGGKVFAGT